MMFSLRLSVLMRRMFPFVRGILLMLSSLRGFVRFLVVYGVIVIRLSLFPLGMDGVLCLVRTCLMV